MKHFKAVLIGVAMLALAPTGVWAAPGDGIAGTAHDFFGGTFVANTTVGECTFCHTPHKAVSTLLLWNHSLSTNASFTWDVTATTAGTEFPTIANNYNGPSAKCLSCHDGTVAVGDVAWFNAAGPTVIDNTKITDTVFLIAPTGDLAGNHPVAMPYPFNNVANSYNTKTTGAGAELTEWQANPQTLNIRLFTDADNTGANISAGATALKTGIECSSCHDPHNKKSTDVYFLRGTLSGNSTAYICLKCHVK